MSLDWLIDPCSFSTFRDNYWSRAILKIARHNPHYYDFVFSTNELEQTLFTASRVDRAVEELSEDDVTRPTRGHSGAVAVLKAGRSLRIAGMQRFSLKLAQLSCDLEQLFSSHININMYLSPPSGKKALSRHFDTHDVFVMQLGGRKAWKLFGPPEPAPLESLPILQRESQKDMNKFRLRTTQRIKAGTSELTDEFVLEPGDFLYLPRGFWHEAETEPGTVSCHLTVGMLPTTYADLMSLMLSQVAMSDSRLRQQLPMGFATHTDATEQVERTVADILRDLPSKADPRAALSAIGDIFHRDHRTCLENRLLDPVQPGETEGVGEDTWVHVRKGIILGVDESTAPPRLIFGYNEYEIAPSFLEACRFIASEQSFTPSMLPGALSTEEKLTLVKQLISEQLLLPSSQEEKSSLKDNTDLRGWVPSEIRLKTSRVRWMKLDHHGLREPFFTQTVKRLSREGSSHFKGTELDRLLRIEEDFAPSGFIFHISRCGSTLLANAMRCCTGSSVISEPSTVSTLLAAPQVWNKEGRRLQLLQGLMRAYGQRRTPKDKSLVVKFTSWNLLHIAELRKLWPNVPCVIVVRDPLEVAVSCIAEPPGWLRLNEGRLTGHLPSMINLNGSRLQTPESICSQVLGTFLKVASNQKDELCHIVDYADIKLDTVHTIMRFFNMQIPSGDEGHALSSTLSTYSKDPGATRLFKSDSESKRASASQLLRGEIEEWAAPIYNQLLDVSTLYSPA